MQGIFYEVLVSLSVSMKLLTWLDYLNTMDYFSIANQFIVLLIVLIFIAFLLVYAFKQVSRLRTYAFAKKIEERKHVIEKVRIQFKEKVGVKNLRKSYATNRKASQETNSVILSLSQKDADLIKRAKIIKKSEFVLYKPLFTGLKKNTKM